MTGYGKSEQETAGKRIIAELRSLNSKQLDLSVRMPAAYKEREFAIRNEVAKKLERGKIDLSVSIENTYSTTTNPVNIRAFKNYYDQLSSLAAEIGLEHSNEVMIASILRLPEVIQAEKIEIPAEEWDALGKAVDEAIRNLEQFRLQEGTALMQDLSDHVSLIEKLKKSLHPYERERIATVRKKIRENLENMKIAVDENRFEQELIFYLEKLDITEELTRLQNHCDYFREVARKEESTGRKLGFIAQEMGREINTIGSKANESNMQRIVVEMKNELEKIKEQVLNLL